MAAVAASGFLHTVCTCSSREQSEVFWSKDATSFLFTLSLAGGGMRRGIPATGTNHSSPKNQQDPALGQERSGLDPSHQPGFCNRSGVTSPPPPPPPLPPPECSGTRLAQRKHWWGNERKAKPPHERPPHTREPMGCSTFPCRDPNPPLPLASPRGPAPLASASHSWHRSPSTVPCHPLSCQPEHEAQSFALSSRCRQAPGAGKPSPSLAKQLVETQHCQGGTGEKAR